MFWFSFSLDLETIRLRKIKNRKAIILDTNNPKRTRFCVLDKFITECNCFRFVNFCAASAASEKK